MVGGELRSDARGVHGVAGAMNDVLADPVLDVRRRIRSAEQPLVVRFVLAEEQLGGGVRGEHPFAELGVRGPCRRGPGRALGVLHYHIEVAILVEHTRVQELVLHLLL